jgi:Tol biopolymer transport system component
VFSVLAPFWRDYDCGMNTRSPEVSSIRVRLYLFILTLIGMLGLAAFAPNGRAGGANSVASPRVTAIRQITRDGYRKANLLADDTQLYVTETPVADRVIARVALANSDRSVVRSPFSSLRALDLSADHTRLLVSSQHAGSGEDEFWTLPVGSTAGAPERVGGLSGRDASWSADGRELVFVKGSALYLAGAGGAQAQALYNSNGSVFAPRFSPDGQRIRFTVSDPEAGTTALWEVRRDGSNSHALLPDWSYRSAACCGSWTADGRYYIFQASESVPNTTTVLTSLWALAESNAGENSGVPVALTGGPMSFGNAAAGRDSRKIWAIGLQPKVEIVKFEPRKKKFVPVIPDLSATDLAYSADGKWIAYVAVPDGTLWKARANGADPVQLTAAVERAALPSWSPDGKQIAYVSIRPGGLWKLSLVPAAGGKSEEILSDDGSQIDANWSPDSARLLFGGYAHQAGGPNIRILDFKTHTTTIVPGSQGLFSPRWSPDGRYIAALSENNAQLLLFDFQSQKWSKWLTSQGAVNYPVWSADSKSICFDDFVTGAEAIRRVKVGESEPEQVFELGSIDRYLGALGPWSGRAADGSWMFVRDRSTQEVYQLSLELP